MGRHTLRSILIGLCLSVPLLFITVMVGEARTPRQEPTGDECQSCHGEIHDEWVDSMHGQATDNRDFLQAWKEEGSPSECLACHTTGYDPATGTYEAEGITCDTCHDPAPADHPQEIMPINATADACGTCHVDTFQEWQVSQHGDQSLACINCHNPHSTSVKADGSQELCATCHNEETHFYAFTAHAEKGLLCTDCHLRVSDEEMGQGHGQRVHTFDVDLKSCTQCHGAEMHYPVQSAMGPQEEAAGEAPIVPAEFAPTPEPLAEAVQPAPRDANPFNYVLAVGLGLGLGIIVAPGIEALYRQFRRRS